MATDYTDLNLLVEMLDDGEEGSPYKPTEEDIEELKAASNPTSQLNTFSENLERTSFERLNSSRTSDFTCIDSSDNCLKETGVTRDETIPNSTLETQKSSQSQQKRVLTDIDFLHKENNVLHDSKTGEKEDSLIQLNSELNENFFDQEYVISSGVKENLQNSSRNNSQNFKGKITSSNSYGAKNLDDVQWKAFLGIRVKNPLLSMESLKEMMSGRKLFSISVVGLDAKIEHFEGDFVIAGVIVSKSETKVSQKGSSYCIWQLSDLKDCTKSISVFLFGSAYTNLWKTIVGSVVGILNPQLMNGSGQKGNTRSSLSLSVSNSEKVLEIGTSKDLGWCKSRTNTGLKCRQFVNVTDCDVCVYHIQKEYRKMSSTRAAIQSSFSMKAPSKFSSTFSTFKGYNQREPAISAFKNGSQNWNMNKASTSRGAADKALLSRLSGPSDTQLSCSSKPQSAKTNSLLTSFKTLPILKEQSSKIQLNDSSNRVSPAQVGALLTVRKKGPFEKIDFNMKRNREKASSKHYQERILKKINQNELPDSEAKRDGSNETGEIDLGTIDIHPKTPTPRVLSSLKVQSVTFAEMLNKKSAHSNLISMQEDENIENYYNVLEKKEKIEDKLTSLKEITVGAVVCLQCKYKAISAAPRCIERRHTLRNIKSIKRFFECTNCKRRVSCLGRMPSLACSGCNEKSFRRCGMAKEKSGPKLESEILSLRGDELRYYSASSSDVFLHV